MGTMGDQNQYYNEYELQRQALIAANERRMQELGLSAAADAFKQAMDQDTAAKKPRKERKPRVKLVVKDIQVEIRKSARVQNLVPVNYNLEIVERVSRLESEGRVKGRRVRVHAGQPAVVDIKNNPVAAWQAAPAGWKDVLGCPSTVAAAGARAAGRELVNELESKGRKAFAKCMTYSQVAGGFWSSIPYGLTQYYNSTKRSVVMISYDQESRAPDSFVKDNNLDNSVCWEVVLLPRAGGDAGWSGGWRAFAIDHMLTPNDTVVFEVMDNAEGEGEMAAIKAKAAAANRAEGAAKGAKGGGNDEAAAAAAAEGVAAAAPAGFSALAECREGDGSDESPASSGASCEGEEQETEGDKAGTGAAGGDAAKAAGGIGRYTDRAEKRIYVKAHIIRASAYETEEAKQRQQQQEKAEKADAAGAAGAGAAAAAADSAANVDAAAAAAADGAVRATRKRKTAGAEVEAGDQKQQDTPTAAAAAAATGRAGRPKRARQQEQQPAGGKEKAKSAVAAAVAGKPKVKKGAAASSGQASGSAAALVPHPENSKVMVPPPTDDEIRRNKLTKTAFVVEKIMEHKVNSRGKDLFLIRWEGFGPFWDSWEPRESLTEHPRSYTWQGGNAAIPKKFQPKQ